MSVVFRVYIWGVYADVTDNGGNAGYALMEPKCQGSLQGTGQCGSHRNKMQEGEEKSLPKVEGWYGSTWYCVRVCT